MAEIFGTQEIQKLMGPLNHVKSWVTNPYQIQMLYNLIKNMNEKSKNMSPNQIHEVSKEVVKFGEAALGQANAKIAANDTLIKEYESEKHLLGIEPNKMTPAFRAELPLADQAIFDRVAGMSPERRLAQSKFLDQEIASLKSNNAQLNADRTRLNSITKVFGKMAHEDPEIWKKACKEYHKALDERRKSRDELTGYGEEVLELAQSINGALVPRDKLPPEINEALDQQDQAFNEVFGQPNRGQDAPERDAENATFDRDEAGNANPTLDGEFGNKAPNVENGATVNKHGDMDPEKMVDEIRNDINKRKVRLVAEPSEIEHKFHHYNGVKGEWKYRRGPENEFTFESKKGQSLTVEVDKLHSQGDKQLDELLSKVSGKDPELVGELVNSYDKMIKAKDGLKASTKGLAEGQQLVNRPSARRILGGMHELSSAEFKFLDAAKKLGVDGDAIGMTSIKVSWTKNAPNLGAMGK